MLFRPSISKKSSRLVALTAAASLLGLTVPAFGQDTKATPVAAIPNGITATTDCKAWKPGELMASEKCEIQKGELIRAQNACIAELVNFKKASPEKAKEFAREFGPVTRENACEAAGRVLRSTASASPRVGS